MLFSVEKILNRAVLTEEVVRLADEVYKISLSDIKDKDFKKWLCGSLYKIYKSS